MAVQPVMGIGSFMKQIGFGFLVFTLALFLFQTITFAILQEMDEQPWTPPDTPFIIMGSVGAGLLVLSGVLFYFKI